MTTQASIRQWLLAGDPRKYSHMLVVCDTFDHEDYPVYVEHGRDAQQVYQEYNGPNMQRVMEVYSYRRPLELQLAERRAFHFD